nr:uncharacterized protein LOC109157049 [Ipomoea batatas]
MAWRPPVANMVRQGASIPTEGNQGQAGSSDANQNRPNPSPIPAEIFDPNDQTNPLHIHANESPTLQLVTFQLEGRSNYHSWARAMEMALRSKNKMSFVSGRVAVPNELDPKYYYWERCNTMVLSWIMRALSPTIARGVLWINTAEGVWKDLKKRFSQQDVIRIAEIRSQIHQTRQGNSTINEYFTQLKWLWDELLVLRPLPSYKQPSNLVLPSEGMSCLTYDEAIPLPTHEALPDLLEIPTVTPVQNNEPVDTEASPPPEPRRSTRVRTKPAYLDDYTCQSTIKRTSPHDISKFMSYESLSQAYKAWAYLYKRNERNAQALNGEMAQQMGSTWLAALRGKMLHVEIRHWPIYTKEMREMRRHEVEKWRNKWEVHGLRHYVGKCSMGISSREIS